MGVPGFPGSRGPPGVQGNPGPSGLKGESVSLLALSLITLSPSLYPAN